MESFLQNDELKLVIFGLVGIVILYIIIKILKWPIKLLLNGVFGLVLLYITNFIGQRFDFLLAINLTTVLISGILGIPGLIAMIIFKLFM